MGPGWVAQRCTCSAGPAAGCVRAGGKGVHTDNASVGPTKTAVRPPHQLPSALSLELRPLLCFPRRAVDAWVLTCVRSRVRLIRFGRRGRGATDLTAPENFQRLEKRIQSTEPKRTGDRRRRQKRGGHDSDPFNAWRSEESDSF